ncbi:AAA family ATPase [Devosia sp. LjRoot3]|uniref:AAA family ATPase n=1 Tax=Devosia sp. LjRoot3 TaxID=3342319 RepID=UPI003ECCAC5D
MIDVHLKFEVGERRLIIERDNVDITRQTAPPLFAYRPRRYFDGSVRRPGLRNVDTLFLPDRKISNPEPWLASLARRPPQVLSEVVSALRHVLQLDGEFSHIEVPRGARGSDGICYINIKKTAADGSNFQIRQRLSVASSGYRSILALVCALYAGLMETAANDGISEADIALEARNRVAIVLIDEIEAHLHPRWKLGVIEGLRRAFPNIMFIMTSHDPLCVRGMKQGEVVLLNRYQTGVSKRPEAVEAVRLEQDFTRLTIEQLLTSELFQMFSTDDAEIDRAFAEVSVLLSKDKNDLSDQEANIVKSFQDQMSTALPYGLSEVIANPPGRAQIQSGISVFAWACRVTRQCGDKWNGLPSMAENQL